MKKATYEEGLSEISGKLQSADVERRKAKKVKKLFHCKEIISEQFKKKNKRKEHKVNALASGAEEGRD